MAKPIRATPELKGEEANEFLRKMINLERNRITDVDKQLLKDIEMNSQFFQVC